MNDAVWFQVTGHRLSSAVISTSAAEQRASEEWSKGSECGIDVVGWKKEFKEMMCLHAIWENEYKKKQVTVRYSLGLACIDKDKRWQSNIMKPILHAKLLSHERWLLKLFFALVVVVVAFVKNWKTFSGDEKQEEKKWKRCVHLDFSQILCFFHSLSISLSRPVDGALYEPWAHGRGCFARMISRLQTRCQPLRSPIDGLTEFHWYCTQTWKYFIF